MHRGLCKQIWKFRATYFVMLPGIISLLVFSFLPISGLFMAFTDYKPTGSVFDFFTGEWVGLDNIRRLFATPYFWQVIKNTLVLNLLRLVFVLPSSLFFALLLDEFRCQKLRKMVQNISILPALLSVVVIYSLATAILSPADGLLNSVLSATGNSKIHFLADKRYFRAILVLLDIWRYTGLDSLIYAGSLAMVDKRIYEAAVLDGASRLDIIRKIKMPHLAGICLVLILFRTGCILNGDFETVFMFYSEPVYSVADIIDTYAYRQGIINFDYGYSAAAELLKSAVGVTLAIVFWLLFRKRILEENGGEVF